MTRYGVYRNEILRDYVDFSSISHINCIRHDSNSSDGHKDKVEEVCRYLRKNNIDFICRPLIDIATTDNFQEWMSGNFLIPDVLAITEPNPTVIEIKDTETDVHAEEKSKKYPERFRCLYMGLSDIAEETGLA